LGADIELIYFRKLWRYYIFRVKRFFGDQGKELLDRRKFIQAGVASATLLTIPKIEAVAGINEVPDMFVLNAQSHLFGRNIALYTRDGFIHADGNTDPTLPIIHSGNSRLGTTGIVGWPSGCRLADGTLRIYAHRNYEGAWRDWAYYERKPSETEFSFSGIALTFSFGETGIGPGAFFLDPNNPKPFGYIFNASVPGNTTGLMLATSTDGKTWQRDKLINPVSEAWETSHRSPNYMCKVGSQWALHYSSGDMNNIAHTAVAFADRPSGPYLNKQSLMKQNNIIHQATDSMYQGAAAFQKFSGQVKLNEPHIIYEPDTDGGSLKDEIVMPVKQIGDIVYFDNLPRNNYTSKALLVHFGKRAFGFKYVWEENGAWKAWGTCQGMIPTELREFVAQFRAPTHRGPWQFDQVPVVFKPWTAWGNISTENPAPILDMWI
jgi:hypothetical protein